MRHILGFLSLAVFIIASSPLRAEPTAAVHSYQEKAKQLKLSDDPTWQRLLHMSTNIFWRKRSSIDDAAFFLSPRGETDPQAEMEATLESFFSISTDTDHSMLCRYPARRTWLHEKLNFPQDISSPTCERYENWKSKLAPNSLSLIFASYYFNNPASMYGHTFLKLRREGYEEGKGLLDYTVNYAAVTNTTNGPLFAIKGLGGGYKGRFSTEPYYLKIQKYNNLESRDLWEYELNLSSAEINRMVQHLWELGPVSITYYFFNKNCSYQLLPLLEVARPSLDLSSHFLFRTVPLDTLQESLKQQGLVKNWTLRPSHVRTMLARRDNLTNSERSLAMKLSLDLSVPAVQRLTELSPERQSAVLDSSYDYLRYKAGFYRDRPMFYQEQEQKLLVLRKDRPAPPAFTNPVNDSIPPPQVGHPTGQAGFFFGADEKDTFEEVSVRAALHDQEADPLGYISGSQLEMFNLKGRYLNEAQKIRLEKLTLIDIFALTTWDPWVHPPSWRVWAGADVARDLNIDSRESLDAGVKGGSGFSFHIAEKKNSLWYVLWRAESVAGDGFDKGYRVGGGGQSGILLKLPANSRFHFSADALRFPIGNVGNVVRFYGALSHTLQKNVELRLIGERQNSYEEVRGGIILYW